MEEKNPVKSFEPAKGINPSKYFDRIRFRDVAGLLGAILVLVFVIGVSSVSYKLHKEGADALDNHARVEENTELTYYLTVKEDGVDSTGKSSSDSTIANVSGSLATITDQIPAGLEFVGFTTTDDGTIGATARSASASSCAGHVIDDTKEEKVDGGTWNNDHTAFFYHGLHYDASSRTVSFKVENIQAGCDLTVGIITTTPSLGDADRKDFYNTANLAEDTISLNSNTMHVWMGRQGLTTYDVVYQYTGDVPDSAPAAPETQSFTEGATVSVATSPKASGYQFSGWQTSDTPVSSGSFTMPATNVTFTGSFSAQPEETKYSVTYIIDGDAPADYVAPKTRSYPAGTDVTLDAMSKNALVDDYSFDGWTSEDITLGEKGFTMPARNIEIHGSFTRKTYKVTYAFEGETLPPNADSLLPAEQSYPAGTKVTLADNPTAEGYAFTGWYQTDTFTMPAEDLTIYGEWSIQRGTFTPEISITVVSPKDKYRAGDTVKFAVTVKNTADFPLRDIQVVENLAGATFIDSDNYTKKTDAYALITELPAGQSITLEAEYTITENADATYTNTVELTGALGAEGYALDITEPYLATIDFEAEYWEDYVPPEDEESEEEKEAKNAATLDKITHYTVALLVAIAGAFGSAFLIKRTLKNDQLKGLKKLKSTKTKAKPAITPQQAKRRLVAFALTDALLVAGCIGLALHFAPQIEQKLARSDIHLMSGRTNFEAEEAGAWQLTKSAQWVGDGKAELTLTLDTIKQVSSAKKDIVFAVDVSGSMMGDKLTQVKADMSELVGDLLDDSENQVSLISFESTASLDLPFTSDKELALSAIDGLTTGNNTNYYEALQRVEEALAGYTPNDNRELYVLILTDGYPTVDSPNEVRQFQYLKELHPTATFGAIQYEMGSSSVYNPITKISDEQFIADMSSLHNTLYDVVAFPYPYTTLTVTDLLDTDYFTLDEDAELTADKGTASADNNTISWDLAGLRSGESATLKIKLNLKDEHKRIAGEYPANRQVSVHSEIYEAGEDEQTSTETPVLKNNYTVTYEANAPAGCTVSGLPESESHFVYQVTEISDTVPTCPGYNFAGYVITTEDVYRLNSDYFRMPVSDVTIKATWVKASIEKTMDGTVYEAPRLYDAIAQRSNGTDASVDFSLSPSAGVKAIDSTKNDEYPVYYYRAHEYRNYVSFAGYCWRAVRTTSSGGVKLIYNGSLSVNGQCKSSTTDLGDYKFNPSSNSPAYSGYMYGTVYNYKYLYNLNLSDSEGTLNSATLSTTHWYADEIAYNSASALTLIDPYQIQSSDDYSTLVGKYTMPSTESAYSSNTARYIAGVEGNTYYYFDVQYYNNFANQNYSYTYGESYTDNGNGTYTINEPSTVQRKDWLANYENIIGKYVCKNMSGTTCQSNNLWFVTKATSGYIKYDFPAKEYKYANDFVYENGVYDINNSSTVSIWNISDVDEREKLNYAHYSCFNATGKCSTLYYIYYADVNNTISSPYLIELKNGKGVEDAINEMETNSTDSTAKSVVDSWYEDNIKDTYYEGFLEDTVFCNDRSMANNNGWIRDGGNIAQYLRFGATERNSTTKKPSLECPQKNDQFTVSEEKGNGDLTYPVGLLTADELTLAGHGTTGYSNIGYLGNRSRIAATMSPSSYSNANGGVWVWEYSLLGYTTDRNLAIRPVVSVAPGTGIASGDGAQATPWELEPPITQQNSNP